MAKNKFYYYVGVATNSGLALVTSRDNKNRVCYWDEKLDPKSMPESVASDTALGLNLNGFSSVVIKSHTELTGHFLSVEKHPKNREDYTGADLNLLDAYEKVMNFNNPYVTYYGNIDANYFTASIINSFDEGGVQDRFLEALGVLDMSYNEWAISNLSRKSSSELYLHLVKKLTVPNLPVNEEDYTLEDIKLIAAYENSTRKSEENCFVNSCNELATVFVEWKYSTFKPVLIQKRFEEALTALGVTYEEWKGCKERNLSISELQKKISENLKEFGKVTDDVLNIITAQNKDPLDFVYALMNIADLPDEYILGYLHDAFGYKYTEEGLSDVLAKYKEENK